MTHGMKRLLVTGRHGFVGTTLAGMVATEPALSGWQLVDVPIELDLRDPDQARGIVDATAPDAVLHLAAISNVPESFRDPGATLAVNLLGTLHLLQALRRRGFAGPMVYAGTGDVYGQVPEAELPIAETRPPAPRNPYAVSKLAAETLCWQWTATEGMDIRLARPFNHIGPGQSDAFVVASIARQIVAIKAGRRDSVVDVGDIDVTRDFTDVRDVVRAYLLLLEMGVSGETYNICSGEERSVRALLLRMAVLAGADVAIRQDPARLRPVEQRRVRGDPGKIRRATGWTASTSLDETLRAILSHWERLDGTHGGEQK
jgi:GDP-4-dehydro-6-deoxy-D-mannose reductase